MILDRLEYASAYRSLSPRFARGFHYLETTDLAGLATGRYEIDGSDVFALVQSYTTKPVEQCRWEAHRRYADIQYVFRGEERMGVAPLEQLTVEQPHDTEKDVAFLTGNGQFVRVPAGSFAIFLPQDAHMPMVAVEAPADLRKVVVKVRLD